MSEYSVQVLHTKRGRPRKRPKDRRRHYLGAKGSDFDVACLKAIMEFRLDEDGKLPSRQDTILWAIQRVAEDLGVGPFAENGK